MDRRVTSPTWGQPLSCKQTPRVIKILTAHPFRLNLLRIIKYKVDSTTLRKLFKYLVRKLSVSLSTCCLVVRSATQFLF